jgi:hypothetical protein
MIIIDENLPREEDGVFIVGDRVDVFVAGYFYCISPYELQPIYFTFYRGDEDEVPGGTGWIPGTITEIDEENRDTLGDPCVLYTIELDEQMDCISDVVPREYIRRRREKDG